ncbi:hypothetical protein Tco_1235959 [Tanacetum coccineum]
MVYQLTKFHVQRVDMVINPPWNLPFLGAKGLTSPEQTATVKGFQLTWTLHLSGAKGYYSRVMANCKEDQSIHLKFSMIHLHRIIPPGSDEK